MMAIRIARAATGRDRIVTFATTPRLARLRRRRLRPLPATGIPDATRATVTVLPETDPDAVDEALGRGRRRRRHDRAHRRSHGLLRRAPGLPGPLREITARRGVLLIFDEVVTGFRLSKGGAQERYGVRPDLTTLAKILAGGLPGGAVGGRTDLLNILSFPPDVDAAGASATPAPSTPTR